MPLVSKFPNLFRIWLSLFCLTNISIFLANIPVYYKRMATDCITQKCLAAPSPPPGLSGLQQLGMNEQLYALFYTSIDTAFILCYLTVAFIVFWKRGHEAMGFIGTVFLVSFGTGFPSLITVAAEHHPFLLKYNNGMNFLGWSSLICFFFLFPNGRFTSKWTAGLFTLLVGVTATGFFDNLPTWVMFLRLLLTFTVLLIVQIYRYRKVLSQMEKQQTKWVVYGFSVTVICYLALVFLPLLLNQNIFQDGSQRFFMIFISTVYLIMLIFPITLTYAILRRRLWDIDPIMNRTLVYGLMTIFVIGIYTVVVWYLSNLFKTNDNIIISIVATSIVAVSFSPVKEKIQQMILQRMYGEQGNPFIVLSLLSKKIQELPTPEQVLNQIAHTLKEALRLPFASIILLQGEDELVLAQHGEEPPETLRLEITYRGSLIGYLVVAPRSPGEAFTKADERLWDVLIQQLGPLLQDLKATMDLRTLNSELQASREKLVLAREEERQYLRRNLHDDLAPRLAALVYTAAAAEELVDKEPASVKTILAEHQQMILSTVQDIRHLVYDLRPPSIDELGLVEALRQRIQEVTSSIKKPFSSPLTVQFFPPDQMLSVAPAVEVAVYRIVTEAVVNVVRHAWATKCEVTLSIHHNRLELAVVDDGIGVSFEKKNTKALGGLGLPSMKERAAELGGKCHIEQRADGGTKVSAWIPLPYSEMEEAR